MPVPTISQPSHLVNAYTSASSLPSSVWDAFRAHEKNANIMYPHALKSLKRERTADPIQDFQCWITLSSRPSVDSPYHLELVLSCTSWAMGHYPVFIFTTASFSTLSFPWLYNRLQLLAAELLHLVAVPRVYSVFAPAPIAKTFRRVWNELTGILPIETPYYAARLSFCTKETLRSRSRNKPNAGHALRCAGEGDTFKAAALCEGFALTSEPFVLDRAGAIKEATELILNGMLWVHEINNNGEWDFASIVATTRQSEGVIGITKVYTNPAYRSRGCAERLVRYVTDHLLFKEGKNTVVLFVAHDNAAAAKVYDRVGFVGLCGKPLVDGVDPWLEYGFHDTQLGHW